jgi:hypothetical protein
MVRSCSLNKSPPPFQTTPIFVELKLGASGQGCLPHKIEEFFLEFPNPKNPAIDSLKKYG